MRHPSAASLLELHFGEMPGSAADACRAHLAGCAACAALLAELRWTEDALGSVPDAAPPADGLERVLARVESVRPARGRRSRWLAAGPSLAAALAGAVVVQQGGALAALAFFALGSIVTLAIAPVLILESQRRSS